MWVILAGLYPVISSKIRLAENEVDLSNCDYDEDPYCSIVDPGPRPIEILSFGLFYSCLIVLNTATIYNGSACCFEMEPLDINTESWMRGTMNIHITMLFSLLVIVVVIAILT